MVDWLLPFGFAWMVVGAMLGFRAAILHERARADLESIARDGALLDYHRALDAYRWSVTVHAHGFLFPLVTVAAGLAMPRVALSGWLIEAVAAALMASCVVWSAGGLQNSRPAMGLGDALLTVSLVVLVAGLVKGVIA